MSLFRGWLTSDWLISRSARFVYGCAAINFALLPITFIVGTYLQESSPSLAAAVVFQLVLLTEAMGCATVWVAMLYFWFNLDGGSRFEKIYWPVAFILVQPSVIFYYLLVYRRRIAATASLPAR